MKWFKKTEPTKIITGLPAEHQASIEIVAHKDASKEAIAEAKKANAIVQDVFKRNHFTVKIYVAIGGEIKKPKRKTI